MACPPTLLAGVCMGNAIAKVYARKRKKRRPEQEGEIIRSKKGVDQPSPDHATSAPIPALPPVNLHDQTLKLVTTVCPFAFTGS